MFVKSETIGSKLYYTSTNENYTLSFSNVKNFKPEAFVKSRNGIWNSLLDGTELKKVQLDNIYKFNQFKKDNEVYNNIDPKYQYIRKRSKDETKDLKLRAWLWDIETDVMEDGSFPDPYKYEVLPPISLMQISEFDSGKKIILGWKKETDVYKLFPNCIYKKLPSEEKMIEAFIKLYKKRNVAILTAWNGNGFDFPYLVKRCENLGIDYENMSPYGVFKTERYTKNKEEKYDIEKPVGLYWLDYMDVYKKLTFGGREAWSLDFIATYEGVEAKVDYKVEGFKSIKDLINGKYTPEYDVEKTNGLYEAWLEKDEDKIEQISYDLFVAYGIRDVEIMQNLEEKMKFFEVMQSLSQKMNCNIDDNLGTTTPWEVFVYNQLYKDNICLPAEKVKSDDDIFTGGYVYADNRIHRWCMSEDVASMYPSIMIALNLSPETYIKHEDIPKDLYEEIKELHSLDEPEVHILDNWGDEKWSRVSALLKKHNISMSANGACFTRDKIGIIPRLVKEIFLERKRYKKAKKEATDPEFVAYYDLLQMTAKILINSVYGAIGSKYFLLSNTNIAHAVTSYGRLSIRATGDYVINKLNSMFKTDEVYRALTDTDSFYLGMEPIVNILKEKKGLTKRKDIAEFFDKLDKRYIQQWISDDSTNWWEKFNGTENFIAYDREKIGHMIVTGKKKYAVELVDNEGTYYDKQKISVTGLETKRSDTPSLIRKKLDEVLSIMFYNDNEKLIDFLADFMKEYRSGSIDIDSIASPTGVSNITKYENNSKAKSIPIHVRASIVYNKFLEDNDLFKEGYQRISNGEKIKWFRLKPNPYTKSDVFAYNDKTIFKEFDILKYIDFNEMFYKTFEKKVEALIDVVKMNKTANEALMNDLF